MNMRPTWVARLGILSALLVPAVQAQAQLTASNPNCRNASALTLMNPDAIACSGAWSGNNVNQQAASLARIGVDFHQFVGNGTWSYIGTTNAGSSVGPFGTVPGTITGTLDLDNPITGFFALALKSSTNFSFYLFNGGAAGLSHVDFTTIGTSLNKRGIAQDLSHASLYDFDPAIILPVPPAASPPPVTSPGANALPVTATPEPATGILMLTGFALVGTVVRRRRG